MLKKQIPILLIIVLVALTGCNKDVITQSILPVSNVTSSAISEGHSLTELTHAQPYRVVEQGNVANEDATREAGLWCITSEKAASFEEYAQTVIQATLDLYKLYRKELTTVLLIPARDVYISYAQGSYAADGLGAKGMTGSSPAKPMYWKVSVIDDQPLSEKELAVARLYQEKMFDFPSKNIWSSLGYDEAALRQYIAETLAIPFEDTQSRQLKMKEYILAETAANHPTLEKYPNPPYTEGLIQTLSQEQIVFTANEIARIDNLISALSADTKLKFNGLFEAAEKVSQDPRWNIYSSWRPYVRAEEYQNLLQYCQVESTICPLLFQKLTADNHVFAAGLIIDSTLPEYLYIMEHRGANRSAVPVITNNAATYIHALLAVE